MTRILWRIRACSIEFLRARKAAAAVEFALLSPALLALSLGVVEVGRGLIQASAIEKGLRVGAAYAGRAELPLSASEIATIQNLVKTGTVDGSGAPLAGGWTEEGATLQVFDDDTFTTNGVDVPILRLVATVPFQPLLVGFHVYTFTLSHEQAYIGH